MFFLEKLKKSEGNSKTISLPIDSKLTTDPRVEQLNVDLYLSERTIVIYAQVAGADLSHINVSIEGEANIIIIEGTRIRPEQIAFPKQPEVGNYYANECGWGEFYRRIILPESVAVEGAEAKIKNGVIVLTLPLLKKVEKTKPKMFSDDDKKLAVKSK